MQRLGIKPLLGGTRRLQVAPLGANRSSGGSLTQHSRPWADRAKQSNDSRDGRDDGDDRRERRRYDGGGGGGGDGQDGGGGGWRERRRDDDGGGGGAREGRNWRERRGGGGRGGHDGGGGSWRERRSGGGGRGGRDDDSRGGRDGAVDRQNSPAGAASSSRPQRSGGGGDGDGGREYGEERGREGARGWARRHHDAYDDDADVNDDELFEEDEAGADEAGSGVVRGGGRRAAGASSGPPLRDSLQGEALYGVFPVLAALRAKRRKVHRAFLLSSMDLSRRKDAGLVRQVDALCREAAVEVVRTSRHELNLMSNDRPHQGLVLDVSPLEWSPLDEFPHADQLMASAAAGTAVRQGGDSGSPAPPPPMWLALDEVVDPQNLGAVVRSAYCLGAAGVLACSRNCAPLSPVVSKASAGALEALRLHSCRNLPRTLLDARDNKGWTVLGAAAGGGSQPVGSVRVTGPTILVLGSEGFGLRTNVRRACSGLVRVDMALAARARTGTAAIARTGTAVSPAAPGDVAGVSPGTQAQQPQQGVQQQQQEEVEVDVLRGLVDSLNVSVATGILLHSLLSSAAAASASVSVSGTGTGLHAGAGAGAGAVPVAEVGSGA